MGSRYPGYFIPDYIAIKMKEISRMYVECPSFYAQNMMKAHRYAFLARIIFESRGIIQ